MAQGEPRAAQIPGIIRFAVWLTFFKHLGPV